MSKMVQRQDRRVVTPGRLKAARERVNMSQSELARFLGVSVNTLRHIEAGAPSRLRWGETRRKLAAFIRDTEAGRTPPKRQRWARNYDRCVQCGGTESRHAGRGWCTRCRSLQGYYKRRQAALETPAVA